MTSVDAALIEHIASLAALDIEPDSLPALTRQVATILEYVSQLEGIEAGESTIDVGERAALQRLRPDEVRPTRLHRPLSDTAPAFREGLFVVPKLSAMEYE